MGHFGGQEHGGHAPANVISKGDYYIMKGLVPACELGIVACNRGQRCLSQFKENTIQYNIIKHNIL